jgi:hypothetical protein
MIPHLENNPVEFAICCVGVFGLFRGGEITYKGEKSGLLTRQQVTWFEDYVIIRLLESKTDIDRRGVDVRLFKNGSAICPYTRLREVWDTAPDKRGSAPLFQDTSGLPITYRHMLAWVKDVLCALGIPKKHVGLHSFRIGGATTLAMLGVEAHLIKVFGRWESLSYQIYTQISTGSLRQTMQSMADASSQSAQLFGGLDLSTATQISEDTLESLPRIRFGTQ